MDDSQTESEPPLRIQRVARSVSGDAEDTQAPGPPVTVDRVE
jgi:hypothetical protein